MEQRKVLVEKNNMWTEVHFSGLSRGDKFKMFEPTGEEVKGVNNEIIFCAASDAYKNENGIWQIDIK